uniref:Uncharacterized protein n=1 Tax=Heterorhabditis bacteriophora TaxID=37862 RepID=A0A1I7XFS5_HETBA
MSTVYIPVPDYDVPQMNKGKYIPVPDYSTVNSVDSIATEPPIDYLPNPTLPIIRTKKANSGTVPWNSHISLITSNSNSSNPQAVNFMMEPKYIKSTRPHIRSIGVSVLPPSLSPQNVALQQNKAFDHHMENHRRFDTIKSQRTCEECHICQIIGKGEEMTDISKLTLNRQEFNYDRSASQSILPIDHNSSKIKRGDVNKDKEIKSKSVK